MRNICKNVSVDDPGSRSSTLVEGQGERELGCSALTRGAVEGCLVYVSVCVFVCVCELGGCLVGVT